MVSINTVKNLSNYKLNSIVPSHVNSKKYEIIYNNIISAVFSKIYLPLLMHTLSRESISKMVDTQEISLACHSKGFLQKCLL